jgi:sulfatase maturation enzyme AslB (radical SAM superfamily)
MRIIDVQEGFGRIFARQSHIPDLRLDAGGNCAHINQRRSGVSPGCTFCFVQIPTYGIHVGRDVGLPNVCNRSCKFCFGSEEERFVSSDYQVPVGWTLPPDVRPFLIDYFGQIYGEDHPKKAGLDFESILEEPRYHEKDLVLAGITGRASEPLLYLPVLREYMKLWKEDLEPLLHQRPWYKLYSNCTLMTEEIARELADMGWDEIRINPATDHHSNKMYRTMEMMAKHIDTITIETVVWQKERKELFEMLRKADDAGVKHIIEKQVVITPDNFKTLAADLPEDAEIYQGGSNWMMLDDGGLAYDLMEEVIARGYSYSMMHCNAFVRQICGSSTAKTFHRRLYPEPGGYLHCGFIDTPDWLSRDAGDGR